MNENDNSQPVKIVLIGESGVGKTSIIYQFVDNIFQQEQQSTIGGTFASKKVKCDNGKILRLEIWDTAGQERYRSVAKMFYKDANAAILVYDITSKTSFEGLQNYWIPQVKDSSPENIILIIAANKMDLFEREQVDEADAKKYAKEVKASFVPTSAKDSSGINKIFLEIAKKYSGSNSASILEEKDDDIEEYKKIRKESIKLEKESNCQKKRKFC